MTAGGAIEIEVKRRLPGFTLDIAFSSDRGGVTALYGRSGAGKSTLVNLIAGLDRPDEGRIRIGDRVFFDSARGVNVPPDKRRVGYVFQEDRLFPHLSVEANLNYGLRRLASPDRRFDRRQIIDLLGIEHLLARRTHNLSAGEKQRVAIGRALLANPLLLLMDEPLANLDVARKSEILPFIEGLHDELDLPIIYVSHDSDEIIRLADTVVLIDEGRAAAVGPLEDMMRRLDLRTLTGDVDAGAVLAATVADHDEGYHLTRLEFAGGMLTVSRLDLAPGTRLRVRVFARDVALALEPPRDISTLNIFSGPIMEVGETAGAQCDILVDIGCPLWARVTRRSAEELGLAPGKRVYALIKTVAFDRYSQAQAHTDEPD